MMKYRFFKGDESVEPLKTLISEWYKAREKRDEKLNSVLKSIPFYNSWYGSETSIYGIICHADNPELSKVKSVSGYKVEPCKESYLITPDKRYKAGKDLAHKIDVIREILKDVPTFSDYILRKLHLSCLVHQGNRCYMPVAGTGSNHLLVQIPVKDEDSEGDNFPKKPEFLTEIKESEFLALQGL